jgi:predicted DNA-binding protein
MSTKTNRPFPLILEVDFLDRLHEPVRDGQAASVSAIIRTALERYDFEKVIVMHPQQLQVSVRLPGEIRKNLKRLARTKHTSISHLVRAAVEAYLPSLEIPVAAKRQTARRKLARKPQRKG